MIQDTFSGAMAGAAATLPMTLAMVAGHRMLPRQDQHPLPPRQITMRLAQQTGLADHLNEDQRKAVTLLGHFGYGAACGALFAAMRSREQHSMVVNATAFGVGVWTASYLGWLPATGLLSPAKQHPWRRNVLMLGAHVIWGSVIGALLTRRRSKGASDWFRRQN